MAGLVYGIKYYFTSGFLTIFDTIIVYASLVLSIVYLSVSSAVAAQLAGFLVFFRLARLLRVINGSNQLTRKKYKAKLKERDEKIAELEKIITDLQHQDPKSQDAWHSSFW